jgi:hypothetical protein
MSIIPSTSLTITVGDVAATLGNATKNIGGFRGFGGSVPASGAISMSQCQKIQYGVGYYNSWQTPNGVSNNRGAWNDTSITNNASMTCSVWLTSTALTANWRNMFHIAANPYSDFPRRPAVYIYAGQTYFHISFDILGSNTYRDAASTIINHVGQIFNLVVVFGTQSLKLYLNGVQTDTFTINAPLSAESTYRVWSPDPNWVYTDGSLNYLWFFPYSMTNAQVSAYYAAKVAAVGSPTSLAVTGYTWVPFAKLPQGFTLATAGGSLWYYDSATTRLNDGSGGVPFAIYPTLPANIYNGTRAGSWYTLGNSGGTLFARHSGFNMILNAYGAGNYDFAWGIYLQNGTNNKVIVYNPFPADNIGYWVQSTGGRIRINTQTASAAQVYTISIPISI